MKQLDKIERLYKPGRKKKKKTLDKIKSDFFFFYTHIFYDNYYIFFKTYIL